MTVGRFAPSPSGPLHLGNLRTALLAWCAARVDGGRFLVRVEDLTTGAAPVAEAEQLHDLVVLGLTRDGDVLRQSARREVHDAAARALEAAGLTYPCYCSRREIRDAVTAPHGAAVEGAYPGTCRDLDPGERAALERDGRRPALRLRAQGVHVEYHDLRLGISSAEVDDFVLRRADGVASYNLAVVVDDADQGVDQVVRGDDLAETTPRQVLLQHLLGLPTPAYLHVPLVRGVDGARLAKRHGSVGLSEQLALGASPAQVLGLFAWSLGWAAPGEALEAAEVLDRFAVDTLPSTPWVLDPEQLHWPTTS